MVVTSEISKALLQILFPEKYRHALRLLWHAKQPTVGNQLPPTETSRLNRAPFGTTSSPFPLAATLRFYIKASKKPYPEMASRVEREFHVDDNVTGEETAQDALSLCCEAATTISEAGIHLRKCARKSDSCWRNVWTSEHKKSYGSHLES